jgi:predicted N-acyltransferase
LSLANTSRIVVVAIVGNEVSRIFANSTDFIKKYERMIYLLNKFFKKFWKNIKAELFLMSVIRSQKVVRLSY